MDDFFTKDKCDRCGGSLKEGRIMSMYNEECICMKCKEEETKRPDYEEAVKKDIRRIKKRLIKTCCICHRDYIGLGNNALPIIDGQCCDECNYNVVLPARLNEAIKSWLK